MPARLANHIGVAGLGDIRLGDHAEREADHATDPRVPIGRSEHPEQIGSQRVALARELAVALPVLGVAVMGEMLDLIEIPGVDQDEAEQPAEKLVERLRLEHRGMAELMLAGVEEVDQDPMSDEYWDRPPATPDEPKPRARQNNRAEVTADLACAPPIRLHAEGFQFDG